MNVKQRNRRIKSREKGKMRFILVNGILVWGISMTIFYYIFDYVYDYFQNDFSNWRHLLEDFESHFFIRFIIASLIGCAFYWWLWNKREEESVESMRINEK